MNPNENRPELWRSLEEFAGEPLRRELPGVEEAAGMDRRDFWKYMGAATVMTALTGCTRQPPERIIPYVNQPQGMTQGLPLYFATAMPFAGESLGLLVKSFMGHPVKVEGNPRHPASVGATDAFAQYSLRTLYDPDRSPTVLYRGQINSWVAFTAALTEMLDEQRWNGGARVRLLTETVISPTLGSQIRAFQKLLPAARWYQWEPFNRDNAGEGGRIAFGRPLNTYYRFERADRILSIDADFLASEGPSTRYARDFAARRGSRAPGNMNRLYVAEVSPSPTGGSADHRLRLKPGDVEPFVRGIAQTVGAPGGAAPPESYAKWIAAVAEDLSAHRGASAIVPGLWQPPAIHALVHGINGALGNIGATVIHTEPIEVEPTNHLAGIRELTADMREGKVDVLLMLGGNPVYNAPADLDFSGALSKVRHKAHLSLYDDETSALCEWHIPETHFLEDWSDCVAFDGTASIIQPLIAPLYQGRSPHEFMAAALGQFTAAPYDIVRGYWRGQRGAGDFEKVWVTALHDGVVADTALPPANVAPRAGFEGQLPPGPRPPANKGVYEIAFRPDPTIWDGRFANNPHMQELPKPLSKVTWDAVALVSPATAAEIGTYSYAVVDLQFRGRKVQFPLWVQPGHADGCITVHAGYGRKRAGRTGDAGYDMYPLRTSDAPWWGAGLTVSKPIDSIELACTQTHHTMDGRFPVRMASLDHFQKDSQFANKDPFEAPPPPDLTLYPEWRYEGYKWGMAIDLNTCVGCNACVAACDMENNIPVVGKHEVFEYREMHWLRVDRYFQGDQHDPRIWFQPVPCMHCENAPCELVCPVAATVHDSEGLNEMIYNRCVGTRFCSNNCPYKVRRFNFFLYSDWYEKPLELMRNPDVTVRSRGVMEKCTYCVQRIEGAKIAAEKENRRVRDGEIKTACQQACPTQAIVFGDLNDENSLVSGLKHKPLNYGLLAELNTRPRTTYLAKVVNLNPKLETRLI